MRLYFIQLLSVGMESIRKNNTSVFSGAFKNIATPRLYMAYAPIPVGCCQPPS